MALKDIYTFLLLVGFLGTGYNQTSTSNVVEETTLMDGMLSTQWSQNSTVKSENFSEHGAPTSRTVSDNGNSNNTVTSMTSLVSIIDLGSMSQQVYDEFQGVYRYLQFVLISIVIITNSFNIIVFSQNPRRRATTTILIFLSCSELAVGILELIVTSYATAIEGRSFTIKEFWSLFRWGHIYTTTVFGRCSICFNLIVAMERFIAVKFPLQAQRILRRRRPALICVLVFVIIFGIHIYYPLKLEVTSVTREEYTLYMIGNSHLYNHNPDLFGVLTLATKIIFVYIPLFGCLVVNILMVLALRQYRIQRRKMNVNSDTQLQNDKREALATTTILISSFLFVLLTLPVTVSTIVQMTNQDYGRFKREHYLFQFVSSVSGVLSLLGMSLDFFVYMIFNREFRETFIRLTRIVFRSTGCCPAEDHGRDAHGSRYNMTSEVTSMSVVTMHCEPGCDDRHSVKNATSTF